MGLLAIAFPISPGKEEQWRGFVRALQTDRNAEFVDSRRRMGVRERTFHQATPHGETVIVTIEGDDPAGAIGSFGAGQDEFTKWFVAQVQEAHGVDLRQPPPGPLPEQIADTGSQEEDNKAVVRRFFDEILGAKNMAGIDEIIADDYKNHFPGQPAPMGKADFPAAVQAFFTAFPDLRYEVESIIAEGDRVATIGRVVGTHTGPFQGVPASGKRISVLALSQYRVRDGKIVEDYPGFNPMEIMQQIGAVPEAASAGA
jgi:steroid delta-isomerase-like uncharacterized protein